MSEATDKLVALALAQVGAAYIWGAWGQPCTPEYRRRYAGYTKAMAGKIRQYCPVLSGKQSSCAGCRYEGRRAFDCRGLTHWCLDQAGVIALTGQGANSQYNAADNWTARGTIGNMPDLPGVVLFRQGGGRMQHTGLYIGGGRVVEAAGHKKGVIQSAMPGGWTHWAAPSGMYSADEIVTAGGYAEGGDKIMRTLRRGATGADVTTLQNALVSSGQIVAVDGKFGVQTQNAVIAFQQANGLNADGVCGPKTWAALGILDTQTGDDGAGDEVPAEAGEPVTRAEFDALAGVVNALRAEMDALKGAAE